MKLFYTPKNFEYFNIFSNKLETSPYSVPFIVNWSGVLEDEINTFLIHKTNLDWNPISKTPINNAEQILTFLDFCHSLNLKWHELSAIDIRKWINYLTNKNLKKTTILRKIGLITHLFDWCFRHKIIKSNPFSSFGSVEFSRTIDVFSNKIKTKKFNDTLFKRSIVQDVLKEEIPTKDELKKFYSFLSKEDKLMCLFILETGVRKEELLQITISMIESSIVTPSGDYYILNLDARKIQIKNNKSRNIILSKTLRQKIIKYYKSTILKQRQSKYLIKNTVEYSNIPVFLSNRGQKYSSDKLNKSFLKASLLSGYYDIHQKSIAPHHLRHFFASNFIANKELDGNLNESAFIYLAERLGHSSPETTKKHYIKIINKMKQREDMEYYSSLFMANFLGE